MQVQLHFEASAPRLQRPLAPTWATRGREEQWSLHVLECPRCFGRHAHGGNTSPNGPTPWGHRAAHCMTCQPRVTLRRLDRIFDLRAGEMWNALRWALIDHHNEGAM